MFKVGICRLWSVSLELYLPLPQAGRVIKMPTGEFLEVKLDPKYLALSFAVDCVVSALNDEF